MRPMESEAHATEPLPSAGQLPGTAATTGVDETEIQRALQEVCE